jgi:uncharacterized protein YraI
MKLPGFAKAAGIGGVVVLLTAGASLAAVATASVNVRSGPGISFRVLDTLRPGEQVAIVDRTGSWCAVQKTGPNGWVSCNYLANDGDGRIIYRPAPSVSLSFGFGNTRPPIRDRDRWDRWDRDDRDRWDRDDDRGYWSGPRSSRYSNGSGFFGLSMAN